jgi:hypothetical protein
VTLSVRIKYGQKEYDWKKKAEVEEEAKEIMSRTMFTPEKMI